MNNASYIMLSKEVLLFKQHDVVANNVANVNTIGFKSRDMIFDDVLVKEGKNSKIAFVEDERTDLDIKDGPIRVTGRMLDAAITGNGYFMIETPLGVRFTRAGNFQIDNQGRLVNTDLYPVLDTNKQPIQFEPGSTNIEFRENGMITVNNEAAQQLGIVSFDNDRFLENVGANLFKSDMEEVPATKFRLVQGSLEDSNVNSVIELTKMIELQRSLTATVNFNNSLDELERDAVKILSRP
jgi:flagellar basal-body rod protein FlgF